MSIFKTVRFVLKIQGEPLFFTVHGLMVTSPERTVIPGKIEPYMISPHSDCEFLE